MPARTPATHSLAAGRGPGGKQAVIPRPIQSGMNERYIWLAFGAGSALLVNSLIGVLVGGPGRPYVLVLAVVALLAAAFGLIARKKT